MQHELARSLRILDRQLGAACGRYACAGVYGRHVAISGCHAERELMSRKIDRKIGDGSAVVVCKCGVSAIESGTCLCLRQIAPLVRCQRIRTACGIRRCDGGMVFCGRRDVAALAAALKGNVLVRGGGGQPFCERELARELAVSVALVGELSCKCVQHSILLPGYTVIVGEEGHDVRCADRLVHDNITALDRGRCRRVVFVDDGRMPAVLVNVEILRILLVDDAVRRIRVATVEMGDMRFRRVDFLATDLGDRTRTDILDVLMIALVAALVDPLRAVLQIEVCLTAAVDKTMQIGLVRQERRLQLARGQRKQIAVELHVGDIAACLSVGERRSVLAHIHGDLALIGGEGVVAVFRSCRHLNGAAACDTNCAVCCIRRDTIAVDGQIDIAARAAGGL